MRRMPRLTLRSQLTLLYAAFLLAAGSAVLAIPIFSIHASQSVGATAHDIALMNASQQRQEIRAVLVLAVLVVVSLGVGWLIAGRFLRPLRTITATARDISASNLNRRLEPGARDNEFAELGDTLNSLFSRLEGSFDSQRQFVANASHELRTPLSAARTVLQVALADPDASAATLRATCQEVLSLGEQQERLIGALLTLATSQRGLDRAEPLDLAAITGDVLQSRGQEAARRGIKVTAALTPAPATGDPRLAESLVANLVDNAIRHNVPGGEVEVIAGPAASGAGTAAGSAASGAGTAAGSAASGARITVRNTGPVVPPAAVDRLFEPFRQLAGERISRGEGHGLGLAIVHAIAAAHGAVLTAHARPQGGLDIQVTFAETASFGTAASAAAVARRTPPAAGPGTPAASQPGQAGPSGHMAQAAAR